MNIKGFLVYLNGTTLLLIKFCLHNQIFKSLDRLENELTRIDNPLASPL